MLQASVLHLFSVYGIKSGTLVLDGSDKERFLYWKSYEGWNQLAKQGE